MQRYARFVLLAVVLFGAAGCASTRVASEEIAPYEFSLGLTEQTAYLHLINGVVIKAETIYVEPDSVRYAPQRGTAALGAIPTEMVGVIKVTRPRNRKRARTLLSLGALGGTLVGLRVYHKEADKIRQSDSYTAYFELQGAKLIVPAFAAAGMLVGALATFGRPYDHYYIDVIDGRRVRILKR